jgi:competence protein ComGC
MEFKVDSRKRVYEMKVLKNQKGFTLIEMMIVLLVISVLLMITVPNVTKNNSTINEKGSEAFIKMVQGQIQAYEMENKEIPTVEKLVAGDYLVDEKGPAGQYIHISVDGVVTLNGTP